MFYFVCSVRRKFCLQFFKDTLFAVCRHFFLVCAMTFCLQCGDLFCLQCGDLFCLQCAGFILFSEWDCILCQELEFILFAVHLIL